MNVLMELLYLGDMHLSPQLCHTTLTILAFLLIAKLQKKHSSTAKAEGSLIVTKTEQKADFHHDGFCPPVWGRFL